MRLAAMASRVASRLATGTTRAIATGAPTSRPHHRCFRTQSTPPKPPYTKTSPHTIIRRPRYACFGHCRLCSSCVACGCTAEVTPGCLLWAQDEIGVNFCPYHICVGGTVGSVKQCPKGEVRSVHPHTFLAGLSARARGAPPLPTPALDRSSRRSSRWIAGMSRPSRTKPPHSSAPARTGWPILRPRACVSGHARSVACTLGDDERRGTRRVLLPAWLLALLDALLALSFSRCRSHGVVLTLCRAPPRCIVRRVCHEAHL